MGPLPIGRQEGPLISGSPGGPKKFKKIPIFHPHGLHPQPVMVGWPLWDTPTMTLTDP